MPDMKLSPNVGSDRSWVWNAAADVSEGEPEANTLAIRFANSDSESDDEEEEDHRTHPWRGSYPHIELLESRRMTRADW